MKEPCLKVTLPGDLYERSGQWWWRAKLPGENKAKARPLRISQTEEVAGDRDTAEKIAVRMWEQAIREDEAKQISRDCTEKVERLKAQFLDKVRQLTAIVESANARAQAETQARTEIETRLHAVIHAAGHKTTAASALQTQNHVPLEAVEQARSSEAVPDAADSAECGVSSDRSHSESVEPVHTADPMPVVAGSRDPQPQTGICECCGAPDVPVSELEAIDSGQLLCPDCIAALHTDVSRIEEKDFSGSRA